MPWLWKGVEGPHEVPEWAYACLVTTLKVYADLLLCVEQPSFEGSALVQLIRIYDPARLPAGVTVEDFASLDQHQELILFEGYREERSGKVELVRRMALG